MTASFGTGLSWNANGFLPPYLGHPASSARRSPYAVSITDIVSRFGDTPMRRQILSGFLDFRSALHRAELVQGFQWVNGSFVTDITTIEGREPRDIDVVTFFHLPTGYTQDAFHRAYSDLFDRARNRSGGLSRPRKCGGPSRRTGGTGLRRRRAPASSASRPGGRGGRGGTRGIPC